MDARLLLFVLLILLLAYVMVRTASGKHTFAMELPKLKEVTSYLTVDVSDAKGRLLRKWRTLVEDDYLVYGWAMWPHEPVLSGGRWVVQMSRKSYVPGDEDQKG
jgi:hypothetical protein